MTTTRELCRLLSAALHLPDLPSLQQHASDLGREKHFRPKINRLRLSKNWRDLGDLKRGLLDLWTEERNALAKAVMTDIEAQRKPRRKGARRTLSAHGAARRTSPGATVAAHNGSARRIVASPSTPRAVFGPRKSTKPSA